GGRREDPAEVRGHLAGIPGPADGAALDRELREAATGDAPVRRGHMEQTVAVFEEQPAVVERPLDGLEERPQLVERQEPRPLRHSAVRVELHRGSHAGAHDTPIAPRTPLLGVEVRDVLGWYLSRSSRR